MTYLFIDLNLSRTYIESHNSQIKHIIFNGRYLNILSQQYVCNSVYLIKLQETVQELSYIHIPEIEFNIPIKYKFNTYEKPLNGKLISKFYLADEKISKIFKRLKILETLNK